MRMARLKSRVDAVWLAAALLAGAGGATLATAPSLAGDAPGTAGALQISAAGDPALASSDPAVERAAARLATATGEPATDATTAQTWTVGGRSVLGYTAAGGGFCYEFRRLAGGCLQPGVLTDAQPIDVTTGYGPGTFQIFGLALDGVTAVSISAGGSSWQAAFAHNSFLFADDELGGTAALSGSVIATMSDGTTRTTPFSVSE
jgi:hypothetical protein